LVPYNELVRICLAAGDKRLSEALTLVESARSRALVDSLGAEQLAEHLVAPRDAFEANLLKQMGELREELNYLYKEINQPVNGSNRQRLGELQQQLRARESKVLEITRQLQHSRENVASPLASFDVQRLQQRLSDNDALVEYTAVGDELLAFVLTREKVRVARNLASLAALAEPLSAVRFQIETLRFGSASIRRHVRTLTERINVYLRLLHDQLVRPLQPMLEERKLIVVPYGALHYLPFHALHDGEKYLIEHCELSYAPSAAIFQQCLQRGEHALNHALLMGVSDEQTPRIANEIQSLTEVFPETQAFAGDTATAEALRQNSPGADVVHLACHGQFRSDNPLFSALRLADGWFTVRDAYSLKLNNSLVTLSACETGANVIAPGDELIGLARGFFSAGARSVLLSLWMVDDETTGQLMVDFYQETKTGRSLSASLRAAQIKMLDEKPHPFFWSPFVLVGHW
jgi:CHAT domain-containing protein